MMKRPWGSFQVIRQTKLINIEPNRRLSRQYHEKRTEKWTILAGDGFVEIGRKRIEVKTGDTFIVERKVRHRIGAGKYGLALLEESEGDIDEEDIVRIDDDFGRC